MFEDKIKQLLDNNNKNTLFKTLYTSRDKIARRYKDVLTHYDNLPIYFY